MLLARLLLGGSGFAQNVRGTKGPAAPQRPASIKPTKSLKLTDACMHTADNRADHTQTHTHTQSQKTLWCMHTADTEDASQSSMHVLVCVKYTRNILQQMFIIKHF